MLGLGIIFILAAYLLPSIIAVMRGHKDAGAIIAVNLFLGWSVVGWFVSFVWSLSDAKGRGAMQTVVIHNTAQHNSAPPPPLQHPAATVPAHLSVDQDTAFWDALANKSDPDSLEEYLVRFPNGRFVQLARSRLARTGTAPVALAAPAIPVASPPCPDCASEWASGSRFCGTCGANAPALPSQPQTA